MIYLDKVTDNPRVLGRPQALLDRADCFIGKGRYALLSRSPESHKPLIDLLARLRPPTSGAVVHGAKVSWPIGRQGFARGKATGVRLLQLICALYGLPQQESQHFVADLLTTPELLKRPAELWPIYMRLEFVLAAGLLPDFDVYIVDAPLPVEKSRFSRLWYALFEQRIVGRTLLLSTYRADQAADFCRSALVLEQGALTVAHDLEGCLKRYPPRQPHRDAGMAGADMMENVAGEQLGI